MTAPRRRLAGGARLARLVGGLLSAQTLAQLLMSLSGFLLLRWLSVDEYAQYTLAFAFTAMLSPLIDLGFAGAVMPLVGDRAHDRTVFGSYVRAALRLRTRLATVILPLGAVAFFLLTAGRGWGIGLQAGLFASVALGLLARAMTEIFSLPLLMTKAYQPFYAAQLSTSIIRLAAHGLLQVTRALTSVTAMVVDGLAALANGMLYRRAAAGRIDLPRVADPERTREIRRMIAPALPGLVFFAFQGQITVLLIAVFGRTDSIAEVGALGRLGAVFTLLIGVTNVLVAPRFPQIAREILARRSAQVMGAAAAVGAALTIVAFLVPEPLLFALGPQYDHLREETAWFVVAASLAFIGSVVYTINLARRFIWWWSTALALSLILATQLAAAVTLDLGSTLELQYFAALTGTASCAAQVTALLRGLRHGPRNS